MIRNGVAIAFSTASWLAISLAAFSASVLDGSFQVAMIWLNASVSLSISASNSS